MQLARSLLLERLLFLYKFFQSPKTVGSITPSSIFLTKEMMKKVDWMNTDIIVEFGAGTGCFTDQIKKLKTPNGKVLIFELDTGMRNHLQKNYPEFQFYSDATTLSSALNEHDLTQVDCIISGLPFSNFNNELRERILNQVIEALKPGGLFITFQYSLQMRKYLTHIFDRVEISVVPLNVPPAFVYCCRK